MALLFFQKTIFTPLYGLNYDDFIEVIENIVGKNANITIEHVDGIPQLQSGKFRQVICNYRPS